MLHINALQDTQASATSTYHFWTFLSCQGYEKHHADQCLWFNAAVIKSKASRQTRETSYFA